LQVLLRLFPVEGRLVVILLRGDVGVLVVIVTEVDSRLLDRLPSLRVETVISEPTLTLCSLTVRLLLGVHELLPIFTRWRSPVVLWVEVVLIVICVVGVVIVDPIVVSNVDRPTSNIVNGLSICTVAKYDSRGSLENIAVGKYGFVADHNPIILF